MPLHGATCDVKGDGRERKNGGGDWCGVQKYPRNGSPCTHTYTLFTWTHIYIYIHIHTPATVFQTNLPRATVQLNTLISKFSWCPKVCVCVSVREHAFFMSDMVSPHCFGGGLYL